MPIKMSRCPRCNNGMIERALIDSDDRIYGKWFQCPCGFDTRNPSDLAEYQSSVKADTA